jgi:hypothetical protein
MCLSKRVGWSMVVGVLLFWSGNSCRHLYLQLRRLIPAD